MLIAGTNDYAVTLCPLHISSSFILIVILPRFYRKSRMLIKMILNEYFCQFYPFLSSQPYFISSHISQYCMSLWRSYYVRWWNWLEENGPKYQSDGVLHLETKLSRIMKLIQTNYQTKVDILLTDLNVYNEKVFIKILK